MSCIPEPLFLSNHEMNPDFAWVADGKGDATVWWDTATLRLDGEEPVIEGDVSDEVRQQILDRASSANLKDDFYFVCGPNIQDNLYNFSEITFIAVGQVLVPFKEIRNFRNISLFLKSQGYRGIVFWNKELAEHKAAVVTLEQLYGE